MNNNQVLEKFINNENASGNNLRSYDGKLYSYDLLIAFYYKDHLNILDYDINTIEHLSGYRSVTTRQHLGKLIRLCQYISTNFDYLNYKIKNQIVLKGFISLKENWKEKEIIEALAYQPI
tara:strand:+ start:1201 stop:1560 length:360 start_codon:yes stop_codon:yes gene_type:complete